MSMEFYDEHYIKHVRKEHSCEMCNGAIAVGQPAYNEVGVWEHEFFSRYMHVCCHNAEMEFCENVDNEFCWDEIIDYVDNNYCKFCKHHHSKEDRDDWVECPYSNLGKCPKIKYLFSSNNHELRLDLTQKIFDQLEADGCFEIVGNI